MKVYAHLHEKNNPVEYNLGFEEYCRTGGIQLDVTTEFFAKGEQPVTTFFVQDNYLWVKIMTIDAMTPLTYRLACVCADCPGDH